MALQSRHLKVAVTGDWVPWAKIHEDEDGTVYDTGVAAEFFEIILAKLNFTFTLVKTSDREWGRQLPNGTWTGLIGMCLRKEVDMALGPLAVTYERFPVVDFSTSLYIDHHGIFLPRPRLEKDLTDVTRPFAWQVWVTLAITMGTSMILGLVLSYLVHQMEDKFRKDENKQFAPTFKPLWIFKVLLNEPAETTPETNTGRVFLGTWLLAALIIDSAYCGVLTSLLSVPLVTVPVDSLEDLVSYGKIPWANEEGSALQQLFRDSKNPLFRKIHEGESIVYSAWDERQRIKEERMAVICDTVSMRKVMSADFGETGQCNYYIAKNAIKSVSMAYTFPKNSQLTSLFNKWLFPLKEAGLVSRTVLGLTSNATACMVKPGKEGNTLISPFSIIDLAGIFVITLGSWFLSVLCLIAEILVHHWLNSA